MIATLLVLLLSTRQLTPSISQRMPYKDGASQLIRNRGAQSFSCSREGLLMHAEKGFSCREGLLMQQRRASHAAEKGFSCREGLLMIQSKVWIDP